MDKSPKPISNIAPFGLRMQPALREQIEQAAESNARSLNQEITDRLERSFNPSQTLNNNITDSLLGAIARQDLLLKSSEAHLEFVSSLTLVMSSCVTKQALDLISSGQPLNAQLDKALKLIKLYIETGYIASSNSNAAHNTLEEAVSSLTGRPLPEPLSNRDDSMLAEAVANDLEKLGYKPDRIGSDPYAVAKATSKIQGIKKNES